MMIGFVLGFWRKYKPSELIGSLEELLVISNSESYRRAVTKLCCLWLEHGAINFVSDEALKERIFALLSGLISETLMMILQRMVEQDRARAQCLQEFPAELLFIDDKQVITRKFEDLMDLATVCLFFCSFCMFISCSSLWNWPMLWSRLTVSCSLAATRRT
jgi:hypothetical protein